MHYQDASTRSAAPTPERHRQFVTWKSLHAATILAIVRIRIGVVLVIVRKR